MLVGVASLSLFLSVEPLLVPLLPRYAVVDAFVFNNHLQRGNSIVMMSSSIPEDDSAGEGERRQAKVGKVPIILRRIPIKINLKSGDELVGKDARSLNVTVCEKDKSADLIQEWWSIVQNRRPVWEGHVDLFHPGVAGTDAAALRGAIVVGPHEHHGAGAWRGHGRQGADGGVAGRQQSGGRGHQPTYAAAAGVRRVQQSTDRQHRRRGTLQPVLSQPASPVRRPRARRLLYNAAFAE